jgi:hypothetical protein
MDESGLFGDPAQLLQNLFPSRGRLDYPLDLGERAPSSLQLDVEFSNSPRMSAD